MRLLELFLVETTEEDRALVSLSSAVYNKLILPNKGIPLSDKPVELGKIGDNFDTPLEILNDVSIDLQSGDAFIKRVLRPGEKRNGAPILGAWDYDTNAIVFNIKYLDHPRMKTLVGHELRHAMDEKKSGDQAGLASRNDPEKPNAYSQPRKTSHKKEPKPGRKDWRYTASRSEINARFLEVMEILVTKQVPKAYANASPGDIKPKLINDLDALMTKFEIAEVFPERTDSPDYKRLIRRAMDMLQKETAHYEQELAKDGKPIKATGNW